MIRAEDDYTHPVGEESNFNESMYVHFHDQAGGLAGFLRVANRPNEGTGERTVCLYLPDGRVAFGFARPRVMDNEILAGAGLRFSVHRPMERLDVDFDGTVHLLDRPADLADPRAALSSAPELPCTITLALVALAPPHEQTFESEGASFAPHHYEQLVEVTGQVALDGQEHSIAGHGLRDHSWGARSWQAPWFYRWLHGSSATFGFMAAWFEDADGTRRIGGFVWDGTDVHPVQDVAIDTTRDEAGQQLAVDLALVGGHEWRLTGTVDSSVPLRHRGAGGTTRIVEGSTTWTQPDGRRFRGMTEYLDQIVDGTPVGLAV